MFVVRPIQIKEEHKYICNILGTEFFENSLAFYAADLAEDKSTVEAYIGICQFYFKGDAEIVDFFACDGREEDEAVIVMLRAAMSFMHRCGAGTAYFAENSASDFWLKKSGFICRDDKYSIDLNKFYSTKCNHGD